MTTNSWETVQVEGQEIPAYVALPEGQGPRPGVVVIHHASGVDGVIRDAARRMAAAGFAAIAPDIYQRQDVTVADDAAHRQSHMLDSIVIQDVGAAMAYLRERGGVGDGGIGIMGFCMGGRVSYLMASANPGLRAAVVFYGGNTMRPWQEGPSPFDGTPDIACPVLGLFGREDANPSPEDVRKIDAEMTRLGKPHEFHSYEGAGHGFMGFSSPAYREETAMDAWARTVSWFQTHLIASPVAV